jgi:hypothetical protein
MDRTCSHCGRPVEVAGTLFCPHCKKALVKFDPASPPLPEEPVTPIRNEKKLGEDRSRARSIATGVSALFYLIMVATAADPGVRRKLEQVYGAAPLGVSPVVFAWVLETILFLPFPWVIFHYGLIILQERRDGLSPSFLSVFEADQRHPHLARSKWICIGGVLYFFVTCGVWAFFSIRAGK